MNLCIGFAVIAFTLVGCIGIIICFGGYTGAYFDDFEDWLKEKYNG